MAQVRVRGTGLGALVFSTRNSGYMSPSNMAVIRSFSFLPHFTHTVDAPVGEIVVRGGTSKNTPVWSAL